MTDVVKISVCEKKIQLDDTFSASVDGFTEQRRNDGLKAHKAFEGSNKHCYIATVVFGPFSKQTNMLRRFRDAYLMPYMLGRCAVKQYYKVSPWLVTHAPAFSKPIVKSLLSILITMAYWMNRKK